MQTFNGVKWQTFGHQNIKNILEKQILAGKIPHAYLFSGSGGLGKKVLALEFARKVLGTEKLENHPDFQILDLGANEIPAEALKDFIAKTAFKPFLAQKKVAIINNAENLNAQSSNALLKTLEEPSGSSVIILIVGTQQILPTIYSRCQVLRFNVFTADDLEDFAKQQSWGVSKEIISLSFGQIGRLKNLFEHKEFLQEQKELIARYENLAEISMGERLVAIGSYAEKAAGQY